MRFYTCRAIVFKIFFLVIFDFLGLMFSQRLIMPAGRNPGYSIDLDLLPSMYLVVGAGVVVPIVAASLLLGFGFWVSSSQ